MKLIIKFVIIALLISMAFVSGCATSRSEVELVIPASSIMESANGKEIYINSIVDKRKFEIRPKQADIPSLDPDELSNDAIKRRAVARKRNTYGKGLGDILLKEGQTVESVIRNSLKQAFIENGYHIVESEAQITGNTYVVDTQILKFWSWMNPGFWALRLNTKISTDIKITKMEETQKRSIHVDVYDSFQTGAVGNWLSVMQKALKTYIAEVKKAFK